MRGTLVMTDPESRKLYNNATKLVCDPLFDMTTAGLHVFLASLARQVKKLDGQLQGEF